MLECHKNLTEQIRVKWKISYYQLYWICFIKGVVIGLIIMLLIK